MKKYNNIYKAVWLGFLAIFCLIPLYGETVQRTPIDINLIIDGSQAFSDSREEITSWVFYRLDQILAEGDRVTVWNAGSAARIIYTNSINSTNDVEVLKTSIRLLSASGDYTDFSGALREAAERQNMLTATRQQQGSGFSYTMLISASSESLSSFLNGPQANLLRVSRIEEFPTWRVFIVGLNLDTRIKRAASAFFSGS